MLVDANRDPQFLNESYCSDIYGHKAFKRLTFGCEVHSLPARFGRCVRP